MTTNTLTRIIRLRYFAIDALVFTGIYYIPALAHISPFPIYLFDPMRLLMLIGFQLTKQKANAYFLAVTIPLFSVMVTGHPSIFKALMISVELMVNILFFMLLFRRFKLHIALSIFFSIIGSKLIYYAIKFVFINLRYIEGDIITTNLYIQFLTVVIVSSVFYVISFGFEQKRHSNELSRSMGKDK